MRSERRWRRRAGGLAILALLLLAGFVRMSVGTTQPRPAELAQTFPETNAPFPSDTASDVVSYADHVALLTAVAEEEATPSIPPTTSATGERTIPKRVTFRVDQTLWSRMDAPPAPRTLTATWWGWVVRGLKRTPIAVNGTPWIFVGGKYVVPIAYDGTGFVPIQPFAVFRLHRGVVTLEEQDSTLARVLGGASPAAVAVTFANAVPDPAAVRYRDLLPRARLAAVLAERASTSP